MDENDDEIELFRRQKIWRSEPKEATMESKDSQEIISDVANTGSVRKGRVGMCKMDGDLRENEEKNGGECYEQD